MCLSTLILRPFQGSLELVPEERVCKKNYYALSTSKPLKVIDVSPWRRLARQLVVRPRNDPQWRGCTHSQRPLVIFGQLRQSAAYAEILMKTLSFSSLAPLTGEWGGERSS